MKKVILTKDLFFELKKEEKTDQEIADYCNMTIDEFNDWINNNPTIVNFSDWKAI
jgi:hypothetical protein